MKHYVYIVRCADDTLYTGYAIDIDRRVKEHNGEGAVAGARYTSGRRPVFVVYSEFFSDRSSALKREYAIKKMNRRQKEKMIGEQNNS